MYDLPLIAMFLLLAGPLDQESHAHAVRGEISRPRIGVMSEQVVRQKLSSYGLTIVSLQRSGDKYVANVRDRGRPQKLELNLLTGSVVRNGKPVRLRPAQKAVPLAIKPDPRRIPWVKRTIRIENIGVEGLRQPALPRNPPA